eukprot:4391021-Pleurochrysis_carterae.AAC.1
MVFARRRRRQRRWRVDAELIVKRVAYAVLRSLRLPDSRSFCPGVKLRCRIQAIGRRGGKRLSGGEMGVPCDDFRRDR